MAKERIGVMMDAFDPICQDHIRKAQSVLDAAETDRVLMVQLDRPSARAGFASFEDRRKMTVAACSCDERLLPLFPESVPRNALPSGMDDWLRSLKKEHAGADLFVISAPNTPARMPELLSSHIRDSETLVGETDAFRLPVPVMEYCSVKGLYGLPERVPEAASWLDMLFPSMKPRRFAHSLSVAATARRLALLHGISPEKAERAGLLHDCAKGYSLKEMQHLARKHRLTEDQTMLESGELLHSIVGAWVAENRYDMKDPDVLEAIAYHNTGYPGMSRLAMCVALADSIEPLRRDYPMLSEIRALSDRSLEKGLLLSLERTADYFLSGGKYLHPRTKETINWLRAMVNAEE